MNFTEFESVFAAACRENALSYLCTPDISERLFSFLDFLLSENSKYNLTAIKEPSEAIYKHFIDSLLISEHIPIGCSVIDVGCGAGLPSIPLAVARPDLKIFALDSTAKKISFVKASAELLSLTNLSCLCGRAEELSRDSRYRDAFDVSIARAVAAFPVLCELCIPFVRPGGQFIALKGRFNHDEYLSSSSYIGLLSSENIDIMTYFLNIHDASDARTMIFVDKIGKTHQNYPRKYAQITKNPLS